MSTIWLLSIRDLFLAVVNEWYREEANNISFTPTSLYRTKYRTASQPHSRTIRSNKSETGRFGSDLRKIFARFRFKPVVPAATSLSAPESNWLTFFGRNQDWLLLKSDDIGDSPPSLDALTVVDRRTAFSVDTCSRTSSRAVPRGSSYPIVIGSSKRYTEPDIVLYVSVAFVCRYVSNQVK